LWSGNAVNTTTEHLGITNNCSALKDGRCFDNLNDSWGTIGFDNWSTIGFDNWRTKGFDHCWSCDGFDVCHPCKRSE
jgi:hypothetical protein